MKESYIVEVKKCFGNLHTDEALELFSKYAKVLGNNGIQVIMEQINYENDLCNVYITPGAIETPTGKFDKCIEYQMELIDNFLERSEKYE